MSLIYEKCYKPKVIKGTSWKIRSPRAARSGFIERPIPEMIEHHNPECKQHNVRSTLIDNLCKYELLTLNQNCALNNIGISNKCDIIDLKIIFLLFLFELQKPECLSTLGQSDVQKHRMLDYKYIQPGRGG